jgi:hypothetical protein
MSAARLVALVGRSAEDQSAAAGAVDLLLWIAWRCLSRGDPIGGVAVRAGAELFHHPEREFTSIRSQMLS